MLNHQNQSLIIAKPITYAYINHHQNHTLPILVILYRQKINNPSALFVCAQFRNFRLWRLSSAAIAELIIAIQCLIQINSRSPIISLLHISLRNSDETVEHTVVLIAKSTVPQLVIIIASFLLFIINVTVVFIAITFA